MPGQISPTLIRTLIKVSFFADKLNRNAMSKDGERCETGAKQFRECGDWIQH
jgi:hypothetical protein